MTTDVKPLTAEELSALDREVFYTTGEHAASYSAIVRLRATIDAQATEIARLKANQRTPGTVEVCPRCKLEPRNIVDGCNYGSNTIKDGAFMYEHCPVRAAKETAK